MCVETVWIIDPKTRTGRMCRGADWVEASRFEVKGTPLYVNLPDIFSQLSLRSQTVNYELRTTNCFYVISSVSYTGGSTRFLGTPCTDANKSSTTSSSCFCDSITALMLFNSSASVTCSTSATAWH